MRKLLGLLANVSATDLLDIVGVVLLVIGTALMFPPAAYVVAGLALLAISWNATRPPKAPRREDDDA